MRDEFYCHGSQNQAHQAGYDIDAYRAQTMGNIDGKPQRDPDQ